MNLSTQKITPYLWFDTQASEAAEFYTSVFKPSKIISIKKYGEVEGTDGNVLTVTFELFGQTFYALNGGPNFKFTPAISFFVNCETQDEVDDLWEKLSDGGVIEQCGWLRDKFGVSWQIIPDILGKLMSDPDRVKANKVMQAMLQMKKIDIEGLKKAYAQE